MIKDKLEQLQKQKLNKHTLMTEMKDFLAINVGLISYAIGWAAFTI